MSPKAQKTRVRILPYRSVPIDDQVRVAGDELDVPAADAKTLIEEGYAEPADKPAPRGRTSSAPERDDAGRRPLTPQTITEGAENRGGS